MISISRVTELTAHMGTGDQPRPSIAREIQRAITLDAGRLGKGKRATREATSGVPRCGKCNKLGHTTERHVDGYKKKNGYNQNPGTDTKNPPVREKKCFRCTKSWKRGHKCEVKDIENNNIEPGDRIAGEDSFADRVVAAIMEDSQICVMEHAGPSSPLLHTPVLIEGRKGMALVDSGATKSFLAKAFVQRHSITFSPATGNIRGGTGQT